MEQPKDLNFEESIKQLENIANELEKGDLTLEESVSKFEQGMELSKACSKMLEEAEKRITILLKKEEGVEENDFTVQE